MLAFLYKKFTGQSLVGVSVLQTQGLHRLRIIARLLRAHAGDLCRRCSLSQGFRIIVEVLCNAAAGDAGRRIHSQIPIPVFDVVPDSDCQIPRADSI